MEAPRFGGKPREQGYLLEHALVGTESIVVGGKDAVEPGVSGCPHLSDRVLEGPRPAQVGAEVEVEVESELQGTPAGRAMGTYILTS